MVSCRLTRHSSGVNFDDAEYGLKEEDKPKLKVSWAHHLEKKDMCWLFFGVTNNEKAQNEKLLSALVGKCENGVFGTLAEALDELQKPSIKPYRPYKTYEGPLTLGDPGKYESALSVDIERYFLTKIARPPPASTVVFRPDSADATQSTHTLGEMEGVEVGNADFSAVRSTRVYTVDDPTRLDGKREVEFESLEKGYEYGRTAVYISESDHNITQIETAKGFSIVGFITRAHVCLLLSACQFHSFSFHFRLLQCLIEAGRALLEYGRKLHYHAASISRS